MSRVSMVLIFAMLLSVFMLGGWFGPQEAQAATITSTAAGGDWATNGTWVGNIPPVAGDTVIIATTGAGAVTTSGTITCAALTINSGATLTMWRVFTVTGATNITGTINFGSTNGTSRLMTFTGNVTLNSGAVWNETATGAVASFSFGGNLTNNATTFTAQNNATAVHTFTGAAKTLSGTTVTSISYVTINGTYTNTGTLTVGTALAGAGTLTNSATLNIGGTSSITTLANSGTATITGVGAISTALANFTNTGTLNLQGSGAITGITNGTGGIVNLTNSGTITNFNNSTAASTLNIIDLTPTITTLTVGAVGNTVNYTGAGGQTVIDVAYSYLGTSGSGTKTWTEGAARVMSGNLLIHDGTTLSVGGAYAFTVTGTTIVGDGASGTLQITNVTGTKTFTGDVTINTGGAITETAAAQLVFGSNLTNNGTYTASTGVHTFSGAAKTISGINPILIQSVTVSGTYTNTGTLTVGTALAGAGTLTNSATLNIGGTSGITTLTANAAGNTVNYNGTIAQTALGTAYATLKINNAAGVTLGAAVPAVTTLTIGDVTANSVFSDGGLQVTSAGTLNLTSGTFKLGSVGAATTFPAFGTMNISAGTTVEYASGVAQTVSQTPPYQNLTISGVGIKTLGGATTVNGNLNISAGTLLDVSASNYALNVKGNWTNTPGGATGFNARAGTVTFNGAGVQTINSVNVWYGLAITGGGRTVSLASGALQTVSNSLTLTGALGNLLTLQPTAGTAWLLHAPATQSISYVSPSFSDATGGTAVNANNGTNNNGGNNVNWVFLKVTSTSPSSLGQGATNLNVTINGNNFVSGAAVTFSGTGINVISTTYVDATHLTAKITISASAAIGARDVIVNNNDGSLAGTGTGIFSVTLAPSVSTTMPTSGSTGVALNSSVTINWNENINCATVNTTNITINADGWTMLSCSGSQAVFGTSAQHNNTPYTVTVSTGVSDVSGNTMASPYQFSYTTVNPVVVRSIVQTYYVPIIEPQFRLYARAQSDPSSESDTVRSVISITATFDGTLIYYDQWEDGYEADIANPVQSTTQIWGDGDITNGAPPGCSVGMTGPPTCVSATNCDCDRINAGRVITLQSDIPVPGGVRDQGTMFFDGGDKISATQQLVVTRAFWPVGAPYLVGAQLAGAVEVWETSKWGGSFQVPVGIDFGQVSFNYTALSIMAHQDGTSVTVTNPDLSVNVTQTLNEGQTLYVEGIKVGANVTATGGTVQVDMLTATPGSAYDGRLYSLLPIDKIGNTYYCPVSTNMEQVNGTRSGYQVNNNIFLYNPNPGTITVNVACMTGTVGCPGSQTVNSKQTVMILLPLSPTTTDPLTGVKVWSAGGENFYGFAAIDINATVHNWGFNLIPENMLTPSVIVGWSPGATDKGHDANPVWVTPVASTTIYVNYSGDPTKGPNTDPKGNKYDVSYSIAALQSQRIFSPGPAGSYDHTGYRIYTVDNTRIAAAWGQDGASSSPNQPTELDLGTAVLPYPSLVAYKTAALIGDYNNNGGLDPGELLQYTIRVHNSGIMAITTVNLLDTMDANLTYVANTTTVNGNPVSDNTSPATRFPLDEGGFNLVPGVVSTLVPGQDIYVVYQATVNTRLSLGTSFVTNNAQVSSVSEIFLNTVTNLVQAGVLQTTKTSSKNGRGVQPGDTITYTVTVTNTSSTPQTGIQLTDPLPAGTTYVPNSTTVTGPMLTSVMDKFNALLYSNNDGPSSWAGNWITAGTVQVTNGTLALTAAGSTAARTVNLTTGVTGKNYASATLSFNYRTSPTVVATDAIVVEMSSNGGTSWTTIDSTSFTNVVGETSGSKSYDISTYISATTTVRFRVSSGYANAGDYFYVDNVGIKTNEVTNVTKDNISGGTYADLLNGVLPSLVVPGDGFALAAGETLTVTYNVLVNNPVNETRIVNIATATSFEKAPPSSSTTIDTVSTGGSIDGLVWLDTTINGFVDYGEPGLSNIRVWLEQNNNGLVYTETLTGTDGKYIFTGLPAGTYKVHVDETTLPAGLTITINNVNPSASKAITSQEVFSNVNFGYKNSSVSAIIGNYVWSDANSNGLQDPGEAGLNGVTMQLLTSPGNVLVATTTTNAFGTYLFTGVAPGTYIVKADTGNILTGYTVTTGNQSVGSKTGGPITVASGDSIMYMDFGFYNASLFSINDRVWFDQNGSGAVDSGEPGISGVTVKLLSAGKVVAVTTSDPNGNFSFTGLPNGSYTVKIEDADGKLAGFTGTTPSAQTGSRSVTISNSSVYGTNFGYNAPGRIGYRVWLDANKNGLYDTGEAGIPNVTVKLYIDTNGDGIFDPSVDQLIDTKTTDANGDYMFQVSQAGRFFVNVDYGQTALNGLTLTTTDDQTGPTAPGAQMTVVLLNLNNSYLNANFGFGPSSYGLSGTVWNDFNSNAVINSGETGISSVTVKLYQDTGNGTFELTDTLIDTKTTDANGNYAFAAPSAPGTYFVYVDGTQSVLSGLTRTTASDPLTVSGTGLNTFIQNLNFGYYNGVGTFTITKTANPSGAVAAGQQITYTVTVTNTSATQQTGIAVTDPVPANTTYVANSTVATTTIPVVTKDNIPGGTYPDLTYGDPSNSPYYLVAAGDGFTLKQNQILTITYRVTVNSSLDPSVTQISNIATVTSTQSPHPKAASVTNPIQGTTDLSVTKVISSIDNPCDIGTCGITYLITVTNVGSTTITSATVTDALPSQLSWRSDTGSGTYNNQTGLWSIGSIAANGSVTHSITATVIGSDLTQNCAVLTSSVPSDTNATNDQSCATFTPTRIMFSSGGVHVEGGQVIAEWETVSEHDTVGFYVERYDEKTGTYVRLNNKLLPGLVLSPSGGFYRLVDETAVPYGKQIYKLIEATSKGNLISYGPYQVDLGSNTGQIVKQIAADGTAIITITGNGATTVRNVSATSGLAFQSVSSTFSRTARAVSPDTVARLASAQAEQSQARLRIASLTGTSVKVTVSENNVYYIDSVDIAAMLNIPVQTVQQMIKDGLFALSTGNGQVSYMPSDDNSGIFFYGAAVNSIYTNENIYWLNNGSGLQMASVDGSKAVLTGRLKNSFTDTQHFEQDLLAYPTVTSDPNSDYWFWDYVIAGYSPYDSKDFSFKVSSVSTSASTAQISVKMQSITTDRSHAQISLNGTQVADETWTGTDPHTVVVNVDQGLLMEGDNTLSVKGVLDADISYSFLLIDSFDIEYTRKLEAANNLLSFKSEGSSSISIQGFTSPYISVFDISDTLKPKLITATAISVQAGNYAVMFYPAASNASYLAFVSPLVQKATAIAALPSDLKSTNNAADYIVITPAVLQDGATLLANYRRSQGLTVKVALVEDIMDTFNFGMYDPNAIRSFLQYAYNNWQTKPGYAVLVGSGTYDYKNNIGYGGNLVPALMVGSPWGLSPSDNVLGDFNADNIPEIIIGRIPVLSSTELQTVLNKIIAFEATSQNEIILLADNPDGGGDFPQDSNDIAQILTGHPVQKIYLSDYTLAQARAALFDGMSAGAKFINYLGHGALDRFSDGGLLTMDDAAWLSNSIYPLMTALTCSSGMYALPGFDSLMEALIVKSGGGIVSSYAPSDWSYNADAKILGEGFYTAVYQPDVVTMGDAVRKAMAAYKAAGRASYELNLLNILGDPALRLRNPALRLK